MAQDEEVRGSKMNDEQSKIRHIQRGRSLHRFLWVWIGLVYLWGILHLFVPNPGVFKCWYNAVLPERCPPLQFLPAQAQLWQITTFTLLTLLYSLLLWAGLTGKMPQRWYALVLLAQAACVLAISLVVRQDNVVLSLYLVLILAAIEILQNTRLALLVSSSSLLFFVLNELLSHGVLKNWSVALWGIWTSTDYAALGLFLIGYFLLYLRSARAYIQLATTHTELEEAHRGLSTASRQIAALTRLAERQRLARELHDTLSQGLVGLKLQLEAIDALLAQHQSARAKAVVQQAMAHIQHTMSEARGVIDDLRAISDASQSGMAAMQEVIQRFTAATGIPCQVELADLEPLPASFYDTLVRIIGEGLTNVARHARANQVWITTRHVDNIVSLELKDDGIGFDPIAIAEKPGGHYGLLGLRERARLLHGNLEIQSKPGAGTCIRFSFSSADDILTQREGGHV
jgi:two-component system, NarL family, sensor histidine kinase YdfH